ncbi:HalOD1 output domain-containing protein [Halogeometricum luteum]|uniref:Halobacterial output domain-containing protein n=1 Tax=Halogeometricum luteum TaxID=2950537 RepID=A0ABU2FY59_9EURY|nr:HalOD1 output domain-containing protein [Halogeometricum sp. S3BR5-2]MDS0293014.1 hypothetical protein [Halogeometricum sp. S3BR5-2]
MTDTGVESADAGEGAIGGFDRRADEASLVEAVVEGVAAALGSTPMDLPPLSREVDLEAVATLGAIPGTSVGFEVCDCAVVVGDDGRVSVSVPRLGGERA